MPRFARGAQTRRTIECLTAIRGPNSLQKKHAQPYRDLETASSQSGLRLGTDDFKGKLSTLHLPAPELSPPDGLLGPPWCAHPRAKRRHPFSRPDTSLHCLHVVRPTSAIVVLG